MPRSPPRYSPKPKSRFKPKRKREPNPSGAEPSFDPAQPAQTVRSPAQDEHPAPQATVPVPRQIVDGIAAEIPPPQDKSPAGPAAAPAPSTQSQPVKVVTIQLNPAELGTLTVRISLRNDALELQVETSRRDTARMVDADRDDALEPAALGRLPRRGRDRARGGATRPGHGGGHGGRLAGRRAAIAVAIGRIADGSEAIGRACARRRAQGRAWHTPGHQG